MQEELLLIKNGGDYYFGVSTKNGSVAYKTRTRDSSTRLGIPNKSFSLIEPMTADEQQVRQALGIKEDYSNAVLTGYLVLEHKPTKVIGYRLSLDNDTNWFDYCLNEPVDIENLPTHVGDAPINSIPLKDNNGVFQSTDEINNRLYNPLDLTSYYGAFDVVRAILIKLGLMS